MALKITNDSNFISGTLTNGNEFGVFINDYVISCSYFEKDVNLKSITIPDGITRICSEAFMDCTSLTTVIFHESLCRIDFNAFVGCSALQQIIFPDTLVEVECWLDGRGVSKMTLSTPTSYNLIENLKKGYAMDLYYKGEEHGDYWA